MKKDTIQISSTDNALYKTLLSLLTSRGIKKEGLFILSGKKIVHEFLTSHPENIVYEIFNKKMTALSHGTKKVELSHELFKALDEIGTNYNLLICKTPAIEEWAEEWREELKEQYKPQKNHELIVLLPLGDPGNLGAAIRSCVGFGVKEIILLPEAANPFLPKALKASAGALNHIKLYRLTDLANLPEELHVLDKSGKSINTFQWPKQTYLLLGEEGPGVQEETLRNRKIQQINIPTVNIESLNASVALSVALYDWKLKAGNKLS